MDSPMMSDAAPRDSLYDLDFASLAKRLDADGVNPAHASPLWYAMYRQLQLDLTANMDFPPPLRRWIQSTSPVLALPPISACVHSTDGLTRKLLLRLSDGQEVETVIMGYPGRHTACLSTQAGCAMGCVFCATGQMGFVRHLTAGEIVAQVMAARRLLQEHGDTGPRNLVLMGMGEPLHNYDNVMRALEIISDRRGLNVGPAKISVSTVGIVPGIRRMAEEQRPWNLAVSLHAATDAERSALVPANKRWPLAELIDACRFYCDQTGRRIFVEWTLIEGRNDDLATARRFISVLSGIDAHVNLIPLNPTARYDGAPAGVTRIDEFQHLLQEAGYPCTVRQRRGIDVAAGCGQLRADKAAQGHLTSRQTTSPAALRQ